MDKKEEYEIAKKKIKDTFDNNKNYDPCEGCDHNIKECYCEGCDNGFDCLCEYIYSRIFQKYDYSVKGDCEKIKKKIDEMSDEYKLLYELCGFCYRNYEKCYCKGCKNGLDCLCKYAQTKLKTM